MDKVVEIIEVKETEDEKKRLSKIEEIKAFLKEKKRNKTACMKKFGVSYYEITNILESGKFRKFGKRGRILGKKYEKYEKKK